MEERGIYKLRIEDIQDNLELEQKYDHFNDRPSGEYYIKIKGCESKEEVKQVIDILKFVLMEREYRNKEKP